MSSTNGPRVLIEDGPVGYHVSVEIDELSWKMGDGRGLKAAYRGGCGACQDLSRRAIRHDRAYQRCPVPPAR